jgi:serine/threonine protein kinase
LSGEQVEQFAARFPECEPAQQLAAALVEEGQLTRYQAKQIWAGQPKGLVLGQYRILDELGKGGFGHVYQAVHTLMDRVVAIKVISPQLIEDCRARTWFRREVLATTQLCHPNIVMAYDANDVDNVLFLVMEYVDGPNLDAHVKEQGPLPVDLACELMRQAALGLQHAHEKGLVHRDVKPANLLLPRATWCRAQTGQNGQAGAQPGSQPALLKVVDFGLARLHRAATSGTLMLHNDKTFLGTPDFVSPEQARDLHAVDIRSDLYSLGCTFYYILTGQRPFRGSTVLEVIVQHLEKEPEPLELLRRDVPAEVRSIIRHLMAKDPEQRWQTPAELITALTGWCSAEACATSARAVAADKDTRKWPLRGPDCATALVPDLAFWQGPERVHPNDEKCRVAPERPMPVPALAQAGSDGGLNLAATAVVHFPLVMDLPERLQPQSAFRANPATALPHADASCREYTWRPRADASLDLGQEREMSSTSPYRAPASLRKAWEQWVAVVEAFVNGDKRPVNERAYRALRAGLLDHCQTYATGAYASQPTVLDRLEAVLEPWLTAQALAATDRETLVCVLNRCGEVTRGLGQREDVWTWQWLGVLVSVAVAALLAWYVQRGQHLTDGARPWAERMRALIVAHPLPALAIGAIGVLLASMLLLSRLLRK